MKLSKNYLAVILVTSLFFLWGFAHNLDPILIPHLKRSFNLTTVQATLVDSAVFIAYFIMAIPAGMIMRKFGYKSGIIIGLLIFSAGCFLFLPAANFQSYQFFLIALFVIACGLTILETAANPYITTIGDPKSATFRLNLAQSFNGFATSLAPVIGAKLILVQGISDKALAKLSLSEQHATLATEAASVKPTYFILGSILFLIAILFLFTPLPQGAKKSDLQEKGNIFRAFKHKHLSWGVAAQFFYVGAQVCVFSLFILYAVSSARISNGQAAYYLGFCGLAFMIGRFAGTFLMKVFAPSKLLATYAILCMLLCIPAIFCTGMITVYSVIGICFFMSIMFPTIFSLGINGLGRDTEYGSSLIIMSIVGGAILPRLFGYLSDETGNIQNGYYVPMLCFVIIAAFGFHGYKTSVNKINQKPSQIL